MYSASSVLDGMVSSVEYSTRHSMSRIGDGIIASPILLVPKPTLSAAGSIM